MFLRKSDYFSLVEEDELDTIIEDTLGVPTESFLTDRMLSAVEEVESYLSHTYDTAKIFASLDSFLYVAATSYSIGEVVLHPDVDTGLFYISLVDSNLGNTPDSSPSEWKQDDLADPRSPKIKTVTIDIAIYDINTRLNPRNIPEIRKERRDEAERWLVRISKGTVNSTNLPLIDPAEDRAGRVLFGGEDKTQNSF